MKSLNRVQKAAKIIRILLKIGYIASIAGAACCVIGAILCGVLSGNEAFGFRRKNAHRKRSGRRVRMRGDRLRFFDRAVRVIFKILRSRTGGGHAV